METTTDPAPAEGQNEATAETTAEAEHPADALPNDQQADETPAPTPGEGDATAERPKDEQRFTEAVTSAAETAACAAVQAEQKPDAVLTRHLHDIESANRTVLARKSDWEAAKEEASACKKSYDEAVDFLSKVISQGTSPGPLFDNVAAEPVVKESLTTEPAADPDAWKSIPTAELIPDAKLAALLVDNGVTTFEQVEKLRASRWEDPKIRGLGKVKQQALEDAVVKWWIDHPRAHPDVPPDDSPAPAPAALEWKPSNDPEYPGEEYADNTAGILNMAGDTARFFVRPDGADFVGDCGLALAGPVQAERFASLAAAKDWCEAQNRALCEVRKAEADESPLVENGDDSIVGASGKIWSIKIATHKRADGTHAAAWDIRLGEITNEQPYEGNHPSAHAAAVWAIGAARAFIADVRPKLDAAGLKAVKAVEAQLDKAIEKLKGQAEEEQATADEPVTPKRRSKRVMAGAV